MLMPQVLWHDGSNGREVSSYSGKGVTNTTQKRALLLHSAGPEIQDTSYTLEDMGADYQTALNKLDEYFKPKGNVLYGHHMFHHMEQQHGETTDQYLISQTPQILSHLDLLYYYSGNFISVSTCLI